MFRTDPMTTDDFGASSAPMATHQPVPMHTAAPVSSNNFYAPTPHYPTSAKPVAPTQASQAALPGSSVQQPGSNQNSVPSTPVVQTSSTPQISKPEAKKHPIEFNQAISYVNKIKVFHLIF
jgi:histone deacetylase complex regulatory component SIN3